MNQAVIATAAEIIQDEAKKEQGGGFCTLALIDENGYPTASTVSISKANSIKELTFCAGLSGNKAKRIQKCNRASVCFNSSNYNITLVGTVEILTDPEAKKESWYTGCEHHWSGIDDPDFCVLRFTTERYNLFVGPEDFAEGIL